MGQKSSCFIGFVRLAGGRRRRPSQTNVSVESVPYIRSNFTSELNAEPRAVAHVVEYYKQSPNEVLECVKSDAVLHKEIPAPDYEIRNGTLILKPHRRDDTDTTDIVPNASVIRSTGFKPYQEHPEEILDRDYVSSKPKLAFLDTDDDSVKQPKEESKVSTIPSKPPNKHEIIITPPVTGLSNIDEKKSESLSKLHLLSDGGKSGHQSELDNETSSAPNIPPRQHEIILTPSAIDLSNVNEKDTECLCIPLLCSDSKNGSKYELRRAAPCVPLQSTSDMSKLAGLKPMRLPEQSFLDSITNDESQKIQDSGVSSAPSISRRNYYERIQNMPAISSMKIDQEYVNNEACPPEIPPRNFERYI